MKKLRWTMSFTKNFKWQLVLVALGASLVLTGRVQSQEIVNTEFDSPASSVGSNFNTTAPAAVNTAAADPQAVSSPVTAAAVRTTNDMGSLGAASFSLSAGPLLAMAIFLAGCLVVRRVAEYRANQARRNWNLYANRNNNLTNRKAQVLHS
jgi:hypothetical protein